jgi:hypothetical protein
MRPRHLLCFCDFVEHEENALGVAKAELNECPFLSRLRCGNKRTLTQIGSLIGTCFAPAWRVEMSCTRRLWKDIDRQLGSILLNRYH